MHRFPTRMRDESGATIVMVAISLVAMLGFAALAIDLGMLFAVKAEAQRAADAAALAGASVYEDSILPPGGADARARHFAGRNTLLGQAIDASADAGQVTVEDAPQDERVRVTVRKAVPTWFARVLGFETVDVSAVAAARVFNSGTVGCIKPFGIPDDTYDAGSVGDRVLIWESRSNQDADGGNAAFLLVGDDASTSGVGRDIYQMLTGKECGDFTAGAEIPAKPGNNALGGVKQALRDIDAEHGPISWTPDGPYDGFDRPDWLTHPRVAVTPTYDAASYSPPGSDMVSVTGFMTLFLDGELQSCWDNKEPTCSFDGNGKREQLYARILPTTGVSDNCQGSDCATLTRVLRLVQ